MKHTGFIYLTICHQIFLERSWGKHNNLRTNATLQTCASHRTLYSEWCPWSSPHIQVETSRPPPAGLGLLQHEAAPSRLPFAPSSRTRSLQSPSAPHDSELPTSAAPRRYPRKAHSCDSAEVRSSCS